MDWQSLLTQIKARHEALVAIQDEIGSSYSDRAVRNEALVKTVTEAIDGQVKQIRVEKENVVQECRDYITKTINMRKAMGERLSIDASSVERIDIQKVKQTLSPYLTCSHTFRLSSNSSMNIDRLRLHTTNDLLPSRVSSPSLV